MKRLVVTGTLLLLFAAVASAQQVTQISLTANDLVYDPVSARLYASVPSSVGANGNSIAVINPATGAVEDCVWVGSEPSRMAVSDDGQYLYVALNGANAVRRVTLATMTPGLQFAVGSASSTMYYAGDLAVVPGSPSAVAVTRAAYSGSSGGVALFVDGVALADTAVPSSYYGARSLAFSSSNRLYGYNGSGSELFRMNVTSTGLTLVDSRQNVLGSPSSTTTRIAYADGLLFNSIGRVSDPEALQPVAMLSAATNETLLAVAVDSAAGVAYAIAGSGGSGYLRAFDLTTWRPRWAAALSGLSSSWTGLVTAGSGRVAFRTGTQIVIVNAANSVTLTVAKRGTGDGTVTSAPTGLTCGSDCARLFPRDSTVTLSETPATGSVFVRWEGDADCVDGSVSMAAARSCTAVFAQLNSLTQSQVPIAANDVAYSTATGLLYASVPSLDPVIGNSVAAIDPSTGAVSSSVWVGSEPSRLAVSSDGLTLYVSLDGAAAVRRVNLSTLTAGLQFPVGRESSYYYYGADLAVVPGDASSVAVVRRRRDGSGDSCIGLFVDGVARPDVSASGYDAGSLAFASSSRLYSLNSYDTFYRINVTATGLTQEDATEDLVSSARLTYAGGLAFTGNGRAVDPEGLQPVAKLSAASNETLLDVAADSAAGRAYAIAGGNGSGYVRAFNTSTWRPVWALGLSNVPGTWSRLTLAGTNRVAFRTTSSQVVIVSTKDTQLLTVAKRGAGNGTVTSAPAGLTCGADCARLFTAATSPAVVTLSATPASGSTFVRWEGDTDCADGRVTLSSVPVTCVAVFAPSAPGPMRALPILANDVVYSAATGLLYASVPALDPVLGNTVTAIDPSTGAITSSVWVGSGPNKLALSSDGLVLYAGVDGASAVRSVNLSAGTAGTQFPLGVQTYYGPRKALGLAVVPGDSSSVVVARAPDYYYDTSIALYSAGVLTGTTASSYATDLFFASSSVLYGTGSSVGLAKMSVQLTGVSLDKTVSAFSTGTGTRYENGRLFTAGGAVIDPVAEAQIGVFSLSSSYNSTVCPDAARGAVYFLTRPSSGGLSFRSYDLDWYTPRQSVALSSSSLVPTALVAAGAGRFAFRTDASQLYLVSHVNVVAARPAADFDGDLMADVAVFRPSTGTWFTLNSSADRSTFGARGWGVQSEGDTPVVGDFDGDGVVDPAVFRPAAGTWFILESRVGYSTWQHFGWGTSTDTPMPGDYDGDGVTDGAVYRPSTGVWYVRPSGGAGEWQVTFGGRAEDVPLTGDFDGDGITDPVIYRPSTGTWFWLKSSSGFTSYDYRGWGVDARGDVPVPADLDGDGKTDLCVFRPESGTWFVLSSKDSYTTWSFFGWGQVDDVPAPADYDGDGIADAAVYRPSTGTWYVRPSSGASSWSVVFGKAGDVPLIGIR
jgi:hypothetical protein